MPSTTILATGPHSTLTPLRAAEQSHEQKGLLGETDKTGILAALLLNIPNPHFPHV